MNSTPKKKLFVALMAMAALLLTVTIALTLLISYIRSPTGSKLLLQTLRETLAKQASLKLDFQEAVIDPFSRIHFKNLKLIKPIKTDDATQAEITVKGIDIRYSISVLARKIEIEEFRIQSPKIKLNMVAPAATAASASTSTGSEPIGKSATALGSALTQLDSAKNFLTAPPVKIIVKNLKIDGFDLELKYSDSVSTSQIELSGLGLEFALEMINNSLVSSGSLSQGNQTNQNKIKWTSSTKATGKATGKDNAKAQFTAALLFGGKWSASFKKPDPDKNWVYELKPSEFNLSLKDIIFTQVSQETTSRFTIKSQTFLLKADSLSTPPIDASLSAKAIFSKEYLAKPFDLEITSRTGFEHGLSGIHTSGSAKIDLLKDLPISLTGTTQWSSADRKLQFEDISIKIAGESALLASGAATLKPDHLSLACNVDIRVTDYVKKFGPKARTLLDDFGRWEIKNKIIFEARPNKFISSAQISSTIAQAHNETKKPHLVTFDKPISFNNSFKLTKELTQIETNASIPSFFVKNAARMLNTNLAAQATVRNKEHFSLDTLTADINNSMIKFSADATGTLKAKNFQTKGLVTLQALKDLKPINGHAISGHIKFPWTLSISKGHDIALAGDLSVDNLNWSKPPYSISGLSGNIPVSEKLFWDGKHIQFSHLISQNPFERVNFERLQPLIHEENRMQLDEIGFEEKKYGPVECFLALKQNMIFAHQCDVDLGSGQIYGEMYFDTYPSNLQLGILARLSGLNVGQVVPKKFLGKIEDNKKNLSGRSGLVINLNKGSVEGRVDITEIGSDQLLTMINVLDPKYEDDQLNKARYALSFAYPTSVGLVFKTGYMDMALGLGGAIATNIDIHGIPIASLLSSATEDIVKKSKEVPLK